MSELLPTVQSGRVRQGLSDYLGTTFALTDPDARAGLDRFLADPKTGIFKGPYVRLRLPFRPADRGWRDALEWYAGFPPYGHQAAAFERLSSLRHERPLPTLVTTGTGSGKTESFLYPILDHVLRARREGVTGTKALILYPMNALANDQAQRLATLITSHTECADVTAALYTGQDGPKRTMVTKDGLITDRAVIQDSAPDILLTNYKMLDQLLLRHEDQRIWAQSATSLQYLVLDEFHTYDGAQGTDVAMLLRRLGFALKSHWANDNPAITDADRARPLGRVTPVATSATLGDKGEPGAMLEFGHTVFGEHFDDDAVITESRLGLDEWTHGAVERVAVAAGLTPILAHALDATSSNQVIEKLGTDPAGATLARTVLATLYQRIPRDDTDTELAITADTLAGADPLLLLDLCKAHPLVADLTRATSDAIGLDELPAKVLSPTATPHLAADGVDPDWSRLLSHLIAALGHVRTVAGRAALSVEGHLWVRELTRIDRSAEPTARFRWGDDGPAVAGGDAEEIRQSFPAVYCRHCGRAGWGVELGPVGLSLTPTDDAVRRNHASREGRFRALIYAPAEGDTALAGGEKAEGLVWFSEPDRQLTTAVPAEDDADLRDGRILPVMTSHGADADEDAKDDKCPACGQDDGIRFLGSAIATLLSVSLSTLFGSAQLAPNEKKALVFTDSVQDAAHRAGFVQARSHTMTLRAVLAAAVTDGPRTLDELVDQVIRDAGDDQFARYRILAPDCADRDSFVKFWQSPTLDAVPQRVLDRVRMRLKLDAMLEFGLNSRTGRTLELTGTATVGVDAGERAVLAAVARAVIAGNARQGALDNLEGSVDDATALRWVRGVLDRMRARGAIDHSWFERYRREDGNRWSIWGGRDSRDGMPAFPPGRPAPGYPRIGGSAPLPKPGPKGRKPRKKKQTDLEQVTSAQGWYARWTSRTLGCSPQEGGLLTRLLLERLARDGVLTTIPPTDTGAIVYAIPPANVVVQQTRADDLAARWNLLVCDMCRAEVPGSRETVEQLTAAPCMLVSCGGQLQPATIDENFYRTLYDSPDMRRVVAREHTSLLDDKTRLAYEDGFKAADTNPNDPNVLVATPTLEMGMDIGDLSTVFLASLPRTVASYLQRVGRAGRLTGNALNLVYVSGRGEQLPKLGDPLSVINGEVRPPATYLAAEEILRRQYVAYLADEFARDNDRPHPRFAKGAIGSVAPGSFLGELIVFGEAGAAQHLARFSAAFSTLPETVAARLREWLRPIDGSGTSEFARQLQDASVRWIENVDELIQRQDVIEAVLPSLAEKAQRPAGTDDDKRALRSAQTVRKLTAGQLGRLRGDYWIGVLEEHGLFPNYTLLDDSVTLDVGLSWIDPDTGKSDSDHVGLRRGSAQAIREFAPGARFYARGMEIAIDAVDLGLDGTGIRPWAFCPYCGYGADLEANLGPDGKPQPVTRCPRCGTGGISDTGQRYDVVELARVSAEVRRDEATITDRTDQRERTPFEVVIAADVNLAEMRDQWFVEGTGFGCTDLRSINIRWLNLGARGFGATRPLAGVEAGGTLFRVCAGCGKLDSDTGRNNPYEHRAWCQYRTAEDEHTTTVVLSRTLTTEGLVLRLPHSITLGDTFALPSLSAALLLGLRERLGGDPDHIRVEVIIDPTPSENGGAKNHFALLLHDTVPGGTGYLTDLAASAEMHTLLRTAWELVRDCECRHEQRLACHRCLLPFTPPGQLRRASRAAAERHLLSLLGDPDEMWLISKQAAAEDPESHLEQHFRTLLDERLRRMGASVGQDPGPSGNIMRINIPGQSLRWVITPQVHVANAKPDFVLNSNNPNLPGVAIFVDGRKYHASTSHNKLAKDADERDTLRATGHIVLALTTDDLNVDGPPAPSWYSAPLVRTLQTNPVFSARPAAFEALRLGPLDWLLGWINSPSVEDVSAAARAVPAFLVPGSVGAKLPDDMPLDELGRMALLGEPLPAGGARNARVWQSGTLAAVIEITAGSKFAIALVLDDRDSALDASAWREWLRLSNTLNLRDSPTTVTTLSRCASAPVQVVSPVDAAPVGLAPDWQAAYDSAVSDTERTLVAALARIDGLSAPEVGVEGPEGIPLDISWPSRHIAVFVADMPDQDRDDLESAGWQLVEPTAEAVVAAFAAGGAR